MTIDERNAVLCEAANVARTHHVNHGDHYASYAAPSCDGESIASAIENLQK